jgi:predicted dienelactone hydrolase
MVTRRPCAAALLVFAVATACGGGGGSAPTATVAPTAAPSTAPQPPFGVTELTREYVDTTRPAEDPAGTRSAPARTIVTTVRVPDAPGPFPLVVFAHGNSGHPRKVAQLLDAWARAGYVVAAPAFPLTNDDVEPTVIADYVEQPADVSFVIDEVLRESDGEDGPLAGAVDRGKIALAGHSLGGATVFGAAANTCCRDDRVDAVIAMSAFRGEFPGGVSVDVDVPLLAVHGTADTTLAIELGRAAYDAWAGPKWFVTLEGAAHSPQYEDAPSPHDALVADLTTRFLDARLRGEADAFAAYVPPPELARIESGS